MNTVRQTPARRLLIIGASARAAAFSALRAGFSPEAVDLFADADLSAHVPVTRVATLDDHRRIAKFTTLLAGGTVPWLYTGGLENRPELVSLLAAHAPLWGNGPEVLRAMQGFGRVAGVLARAGAVVPAEADLSRFGRPPLIEPPGDLSRWLVKPRASAGGKAILRGDEAWSQLPELSTATHYLQERVDGVPAAAAYISDGARCWLLGATQQLVGEEWLGARPFAWCGNAGPLALDESSSAQLHAIGKALVGAFGLRGLFGVDFILRSTDGAVVPIEVNPRYPASVEILEHALGTEALALHAAAFQRDPRVFQKTLRGCFLRAAPAITEAASPVRGKAIIYTPHRLRIGVDLLARFPSHPSAWPAVADIPAPGTEIAAGQPVCTVFAAARTRRRCIEELRRVAAEVRGIFTTG